MNEKKRMVTIIIYTKTVCCTRCNSSRNVMFGSFGEGVMQCLQTLKKQSIRQQKTVFSTNNLSKTKQEAVQLEVFANNLFQHFILTLILVTHKFVSLYLLSSNTIFDLWSILCYMHFKIKLKQINLLTIDALFHGIPT